jgi:hypothetical protein
VVIPICTAGSTLAAVHSKLDRMIKQNTVFPSEDPNAGPVANPSHSSFGSWATFDKYFLAEYRQALFLNARFRSYARTLLKAWLRRYRFQQGNDVDLVTLETPRQPVTLVDWPSRRTYSFEAGTILKDCVERLLCQDLELVTPQQLRNPYTNMPLTYGQAFHIIQQLRAFGRSHWTLEAYASPFTQYNFSKFCQMHNTPLRHSALDRIFRNPRSSDCVDLVYEFIRDEHDNHGQSFNVPVYLWALRHEDTSLERIVKWRELCKKYHLISILHSDVAEMNAQINRHIVPATEALCGPPQDLIILRNLEHKQLVLKQARQNRIVTTE